jgi:hypothetical protein
MLPPLVALNIGTTKRANDSSVAIDVVSKRLKVSDFDLFQLQRYAVLVIYAKDMFSSITKFQRRESGQMPNIHIEDTLVYKAITEKENGQELWSSLEGYMKPLFLKSFDLNAMETISYQNALNYLLLFTMFPTVDVSLQQLLSTYSIQLPVDDQAKLESIMTILRRPTLSTHEDDSEYRWSFPEGMQVSDKLVKDMTENLNWTPHFVKALTMSSLMMDEAFTMFGVEIESAMDVYRGVSMEDNWDVFYETVDGMKVPKIETWNQMLPASVLSTTLNKKTALNFCGEINNTCVVYKFTLSPGLRVLPLTATHESWGRKLIEDEFSPHKEQEILLPRNAVFTPIDADPRRIDGPHANAPHFEYHMNVSSLG